MWGTGEGDVGHSPCESPCIGGLLAIPAAAKKNHYFTEMGTISSRA